MPTCAHICISRACRARAEGSPAWGSVLGRGLRLPPAPQFESRGDPAAQPLLGGAQTCPSPSLDLASNSAQRLAPRRTRAGAPRPRCHYIFICRLPAGTAHTLAAFLPLPAAADNPCFWQAWGSRSPSISPNTHWGGENQGSRPPALGLTPQVVTATRTSLQHLLSASPITPRALNGGEKPGRACSKHCFLAGQRGSLRHRIQLCGEARKQTRPGMCCKGLWRVPNGAPQSQLPPGGYKPAMQGSGFKCPLCSGSCRKAEPRGNSALICSGQGGEARTGVNSCCLQELLQQKVHHAVASSRCMVPLP